MINPLASLWATLLCSSQTYSLTLILTLMHNKASGNNTVQGSINIPKQHLLKGEHVIKFNKYVISVTEQSRKACTLSSKN